MASGNKKQPFFFLILMGVGLFVLALARLYGLDQAPPGFYVDEAAGATHAICLSQTGKDFFGQTLPLFSRGLGGGYYTAPYLYGEALWIKFFGNSVSAFRSFPAFITLLTILGLFLWVRKKINANAALWVALLASISPWGFQFSRIAWDPPLAPFFLVFALLALELKNHEKIRLGLTGFLFALAAYAYPPERAQVLLLLGFMPGVKWRDKFKISLIFIFFLVPLLMKSFDPVFTGRARMLAIWSDYPSNPYSQEDFFGLVVGFFDQFFSHFSFDFLFLHGDHNLRHSIQTFGMLSVVEGVGLVLCFVLWGFRFKNKKILSPSELQVIFISALGVASGVLPAALTWEGVPHALRAIGAWVFFSVLAGVAVAKICERKKMLAYGFLLASFAFSFCYWKDYFYEYPERALAWFQIDETPLARAYLELTKEKITYEKILENKQN